MPDIPPVRNGKIGGKQGFGKLLFPLQIVAPGEQGEPRLLGFIPRQVICVEFIGIRQRRDHHIFVRRFIGEHACLHRQANRFYHNFQLDVYKRQVWIRL